MREFPRFDAGKPVGAAFTINNIKPQCICDCAVRIVWDDNSDLPAPAVDGLVLGRLWAECVECGVRCDMDVEDAE